MNNGIIAKVTPHCRTFPLRESAFNDLGVATLLTGPFRVGNRRAQKLLKERIKSPFCERAPIAATQDAIDALLAHPVLALIKIAEHASVNDYREYRFEDLIGEEYRVSHRERLKRLEYILRHADGTSKIIRPGKSALLAQIKRQLAVSAPDHPLNELFRILKSGHITFDYVPAKEELTISFEENPPGERKRGFYRGMYGEPVASLLYEKLWVDSVGKAEFSYSNKLNNFERFINEQLRPPLDELSFCLALAQAVKQSGFVRPELTEDVLEITDGWHPGLAEPVKQTITMPASQNVLTISGPNDGGKTTTLRTLGWISLLAQIGSFVPCRQARLPIFDNFFTHFHVADQALCKGQFANEVEQFNQWWREMSGRSLLLADELFSGTDPVDGQILFASTVEELPGRIGKAVVATHFRGGLRQIDAPAVGHMRMTWVETEQGPISTYEIEKGVSEENGYGLACAERFGLPPEIVARARRSLR